MATINYISIDYNKINECINSDTIYIINNIPNESGNPESGVLLAAEVGDRCTQYLFTNTGRVLVRYKVNGIWNENFENLIPFGSFQDVAYKAQIILDTTNPGDDVAKYPSVAAVKEYVKAYVDYLRDEIPPDNYGDYYTKKEIDGLLANKMNRQVGTYENIDSYTKTNTIYTGIDFGLTESGAHEYATIICVQGMGKANRYAQYAFTNTGKILLRRQINGVWEETFSPIN